LVGDAFTHTSVSGSLERLESTRRLRHRATPADSNLVPFATSACRL
jgi:hypothetical protein